MGKNKGTFLALSAAVFWASIGLVARFLYGLGADPLFIVSARSVLATLAMVLLGTLSYFRHHIKLKHILLGIVYGFVAIGANFLLYFYAVRFTKVALAAAIIYVNPAFVMLLSRIFLKEKQPVKNWLSLIVVTIGVWLLASAPHSLRISQELLGIGFALGCAFSIAVYNVAGKALLAYLSPWETLTLALMGGSILLVTISAGLGIRWPRLPASGWLGILFLALCPTILGYGLYLKAVKLIGPTKSSLLATSEPVFAALLAWAVFHETLQLLQIVGVVLIILGAIVLQIKSQTSHKT